ncbi:cysteine peptidase family C39 domain-containing protein [Methanobrevibacter sp.]|uniref:cysteine peptidase family C39 domain-containing protein n=1 Tax=Methanobrevibacter sp. TaxID=66852 RepID=UPI0026DEC086|nr:cysteine peptidase family C39 domain-containing protein [Methanobrevibacter sp.]MDO5860176.1 cysteine peptidase family C39 domain-containing protein [Methanobrevibacter sp.]
MNSKTKFTLICLFLALFSIAIVSANDVNSTDLQANHVDDSVMSVDNDLNKVESVNYMSDSNNESNLKVSEDSIISKDSNQDAYSVSNKTVKLDTQITSVSNMVIKGKNFQIYLKDKNNAPVKNVTVIFKLDKTNFKATTNSKGLATLTITKDVGTYPITVSFNGNKDYTAVSKTFNVVVPRTVSIVIVNDKLLTNGYLRAYLKSSYSNVISGKTLTIKIGSKTFNKATNSEGYVIIKPKAGTRTYSVSVSFAGTNNIAGASKSKNVTGVKGSALNLFINNVPQKNGVPDIDYLVGNYVMADGNAKYTLLKAQYHEVIKRDSYCLYLNNKLTKYTVFKSKSEPYINHIIKREKWNVIEREINTKVVLKNTYKYWPGQITADLKGKAYTYSEVRDVQDTGYTCGPTSCSMCSQVLRNYVNEWQLSKMAGTDPNYGSSTSGLKAALEKYNMKCSYFYKSSWTTALNALKKGGCALVFHTWYHYVCILDISKDGKKVLVGNPSGDYNTGSHAIPTKWLTVNYMYNRFNNYDTSSLIVKLKYSLSAATKTKINKFYSNMGKWTRSNTNERIPQID